MADDKEGLALYIRTDTGEEVRRRVLSDSERQLKIPLGPPAGKDAHKGEARA